MLWAATVVGAIAQDLSAPRVTTARSRSHAAIMVDAGALQVRFTVTQAGFELDLTEGSDRIHMRGNKDGDVSVRRGHEEQRFNLQRGAAAEHQAVSTLLASSPALARFDALMRGDWARSAKEAKGLAAAQAMTAIFRGQVAPARAWAATVGAPPPEVSWRRVRQAYTPSQCHAVFEHEVVNAYRELESCAVDAASSWNPFASAWCGYSFHYRIAAATLWLSDCYGW